MRLQSCTVHLTC